jgi:pyruvate/2-oxoglutarate dehydrogenase complex dihydrolipoamide dehydrogenase (E3) component
VNVGCIPKKLMHQAGLLGGYMRDAEKYGWQLNSEATLQHSWDSLRDSIHEYIASLNWGYRVQLRKNNIEYLNAMGKFIDPHTIQATTFDKKSQPKTQVSICLIRIIIIYNFIPF